MRAEEYRPSPEELARNPRDLARDITADAARDGVDTRDVLPASIAECLDDHARSVAHALEEQFGVPEVPEDMRAAMELILQSIAQNVDEHGYVDEMDETCTERLRVLAVQISNYRDHPSDIAVTAVPEAGYTVSYTTGDGQRVERALSVPEMDTLFHIELWADQYNQLRNIEQFRGALTEAHASARRTDPEEQRAEVRRTMQRKYGAFGFTAEQIDNLVLLAETGELPEMVPEGDAGLRKLDVMRDVWQRYLSDAEKSAYTKLAAGIVATGALEGGTPVLLQKMMDSGTVQTAALFAAGYFSAVAGLGWVRKKLTLEFDQFVNAVAERPGGLNERLSRDLAFQPGERVAETGERGRLMTAMRRSQDAFREILSGTAKVTAPAIASAVAGIGVMMASDWRLGAFSLASAPIAFAIARRAQRTMEPIITESYQTEDRMALEVAEQIDAHMEIVLSGMRDAMGPRLESLMARSNALQHERVAARAAMNFQMGSALNPAVLAGLTIAGVALRGVGVQESGKIISAIVYSSMFRQAFDTIMHQQAQILDSVASIVEMEEVFNGYADAEVAADAERVSAAELPNFSMDLRDVTLRVAEKTIIDHVNVAIPAGGIVRIEGMSGHGKTTLTKLMAGYYRPTDGDVRIGGVRVDGIQKAGPGSLYAHIAYLSQHPYVFDSGNIRENLSFGNPDATDTDMRRVLHELGLEERFSNARGVDLTSAVTGLSGGERTRLGLARILLKIRRQENGGIVFLDEPTEGLDEETEADVAEILVREKRAHPNITFVIVSHRRSFIEELERTRDGAAGWDIQRIRMARGRQTAT